jgi:YesN/AraC family two-component response regulator
MQKAIICVDDEKSISWGVQQQIARSFPNKYLLEIAESGEEALEILQEFKEMNIELFMLITDQMMPGIKGHELIKEINEKSPSSKCILLTGYAEENILNQVSNLNVYKILKKPWEFEELARSISEADTN